MFDSRDDASKDGGFEPVYVELDWYDGPRGGLADIGGVPHYFRALNDYARPGDPDDEHFVWPAGQTALAWECEQWAIFVEWNARYEAGTATPDSHPGHGGVNIRYDELTRLLQPHRMMPTYARRMKVEWRWDPSPTRPRYHTNGPGYRASWRPA
ncbi:hypothetical protein AB0F73_04450 [Micromonospora purpureochromogenes]|uniref:hypothetical protein n=1 Tax=Micromonospora purpureochromogenes TaxID=47872 RepID=UPI0033D59386